MNRIAELPNSDTWVSVQLGRLARIRRGASPRPIDNPRWFSHTGPGWVRISDVTRAKGRLRYTEQYLSPEGVLRTVQVMPGNVLMSICATIGEPVIVDMDACIHDGFVVFDQFEEKLDRNFLLHLLRQISPAFRAQGQTGTQANLNTDIVKNAIVTIPASINEQGAIASILDATDAAIEQTEALVAKLKQVRAGLLHDLMIHGVDENGEIRAVSAERNIVGWTKAKVGELFDMQLGKMLNPKARRSSSPLPYLGNRHVLWNRVDCADPEYMDFSAIERDKFRLRAGDLLVCEGGEVGRTAIWRDELDECYFQKAIHRLRPKDERIHPEYMLAFMHRAAETSAFLHLTVQTSIAHLPQEKLALLEVPLPPRSEQGRMIAVLDASDAELMAGEAQLVKLRAIKQGLSDDLLTSRVGVPAEEEKEFV